MSFILLVVLLFLIIGVILVLPYNHSWSYYPSGVLGVILIITVILLLLGKI